MEPPSLSEELSFSSVVWNDVPDRPGVYVIYEGEEVLYVGMAGRDGKGSLRRRLRDHASGQIVNMFAQYLFLNRVQFLQEERITHPVAARLACRSYIHENCTFRYAVLADGREARLAESALKVRLSPTLNPG